jgi:predicted Zn-dependent peptidase
MGPTGDVSWLNAKFAAVAEVTADDVKAFVRTYLVKENRTVVTVRPPAEATGGAP